ncbi:MAG TPA: zinc ribbon domain-containing protein [Thermomicrobiales bacterium]|nr:zinc ribbon domain-containing protein [Thermomicrobiales bacterium]
MLELAARAAQILVALGGAYLIALWFVLIVWTYRDIEGRSGSVLTQVFSTLLVVLFFIPGVLLYLLLRPKDTLDQAFQRSLEEEYLLQDLEDLPHCPTCHRNVADDFTLCPHCHTQLRQPCSNCSRLVDMRWNVCPYCASPQHGQPEGAPRVEAPAARWIAPTARRRRLPDAERAALTRPDAAAGTATTESDAVAAAPASDRPANRSVVRPLDRFRGRFTQPAEGASSSPSPLDAPTSPLAASLGSDLLRGMSAYQALGGASSRNGAPHDDGDASSSPSTGTDASGSDAGSNAAKD